MVFFLFKEMANADNPYSEPSYRFRFPFKRVGSDQHAERNNGHISSLPSFCLAWAEIYEK